MIPFNKYQDVDANHNSTSSLKKKTNCVIENNFLENKSSLNAEKLFYETFYIFHESI